MRTHQWSLRESLKRRCKALAYAAAVFLLLLSAYFLYRFNIDRPVDYVQDDEHFKYGSTGGERVAGIPYWIWKALPELFPEYLPGKGYASLGFIYEPGRDLPVGVSKRNVMGIDRVFLNCGVCHVGTVRETPRSEPTVIVGMPANRFDLGKFQQFLFNSVTDEKFTPERILLEIDHIGGDLDLINRIALQYYGINRMREQLLMLRHRFRFVNREPEFGPGRTDTFNPAKVLLNFPMEKLPKREWIGLVDFPSVWLQGPRKGMQLHWDGNNNSVEERNKSAAFGTGTTPPTIDLRRIARIEKWLLTKNPPRFPFPINKTRASKGEKLYRKYCADCHGQSGRDFEGSQVGKVVPIEDIGTDRHRLDSYTHTLSVNQSTLYAGYPWRFKHFQKTFGYANMPLDGVWLRAPYLHNGSVPTLRDLLEPVRKRPKEFYRGYDVYDQRLVGFVSTVAEEQGRKYFRFDTRLPGNGNQGHEGPDYGTTLTPLEKDDIVEYLKTF